MPSRENRLRQAILLRKKRLIHNLIQAGVYQSKDAKSLEAKTLTDLEEEWSSLVKMQMTDELGS